MNTDPYTPLTQLPRALAEICRTAAPPTYHQLYMAALNGRFRTERRGRQYYIKNEDLHTVAEVFGLVNRVDA